MPSKWKWTVQLDKTTMKSLFYQYKMSPEEQALPQLQSRRHLRDTAALHRSIMVSHEEHGATPMHPVFISFYQAPPAQ